MTTALSRLRGATVIAARSALTLKGKPVDVKQLGSDLDVRIMRWRASVMRSDGSVRINARLIDTNRKTLWSDRFDVDRSDILRTQDEIVTRLASTLHGELYRRNRRSRTTGASNLDAEDLAMQCEAATYRLGYAGMPNYELCERALNIDPATCVPWSSSRRITVIACRACKAPTPRPTWSEPMFW